MGGVACLRVKTWESPDATVRTGPEAPSGRKSRGREGRLLPTAVKFPGLFCLAKTQVGQYVVPNEIGCGGVGGSGASRPLARSSERGQGGLSTREGHR